MPLATFTDSRDVIKFQKMVPASLLLHLDAYYTWG